MAPPKKKREGGPGRHELPAGAGREDLQTTIHPATMRWLRSAARRRSCGMGRVLDDLVDRAYAITELVKAGEEAAIETTDPLAVQEPNVVR